jgi:hypothetical protein
VLLLTALLAVTVWWGWGLVFPRGQLLLHVEDATDGSRLADRMAKACLYRPEDDRTFPLRLGMQTLPVGSYELKKTSDQEDLRFSVPRVAVDRGETSQVTVWVHGKVSDAWLADVSSRPAEEQWVAVADKLRERNDGFDTLGPPRIEDGKLVDLDLITDRVSDISPLQALGNLQRLHCAGSQPGMGALSTLGPLQELALTRLNCANNPELVDLEPLRGLRLRGLDCSGTGVHDLAPLRHMPLEELRCQGTPVSDFTVLNFLPLVDLHVDVAAAKGLIVLRGHESLKRINGKPAAEFWRELDVR